MPRRVYIPAFPQKEARKEGLDILPLCHILALYIVGAVLSAMQWEVLGLIMIGAGGVISLIFFRGDALSTRSKLIIAVMAATCLVIAGYYASAGDLDGWRFAPKLPSAFDQERAQNFRDAGLPPERPRR